MHEIQIWLGISVANLLKAHGKGFTPTLDATAGTHSCLNRMLMKEKHRKSRGFGSSWCTHTHTHTHIHHTYVQKWRRPVYVHRCQNALQRQSRIVCKLGQKVTGRGSVRVVLYAPGSANTGRTELTNSGNQTATGTKRKATETIPSIPHSTVKQASSHVDESLLSCNCTYEAQAAQTSAPWAPWPLWAPTPPLSPPPLPHYQINLSCCSVSDVIYAELQMLKDPWGYVV